MTVDDATPHTSQQRTPDVQRLSAGWNGPLVDKSEGNNQEASGFIACDYKTLPFLKRCVAVNQSISHLVKHQRYHREERVLSRYPSSIRLKST